MYFPVFTNNIWSYLPWSPVIGRGGKKPEDYDCTTDGVEMERSLESGILYVWGNTRTHDEKVVSRLRPADNNAPDGPLMLGGNTSVLSPHDCGPFPPLKPRGRFCIFS